MGGLGGGAQNLADAKVGVAHHAHIFIAPVLSGGPLDDVVNVPHLHGVVHAVPLALALADAPGIGDDVGVAPLDKVVDVAGLQRMVEEEGLGGDGAPLDVLHLLAVGRPAYQGGHLARPLGQVDVHAQAHAVPQGEPHVLMTLHLVDGAGELIKILYIAFIPVVGQGVDAQHVGNSFFHSCLLS